MRLEISGKHLETGEALKTHVEQQVTEVVGKYFKDAIDAKVIFSKHGHFYVCEVIVDEGVKGSTPVTAKDQSDDVYAAFNLTLDRVGKQLRRYKRKLKDRSHKVGLGELSAKVASAM